MHPTWRLCVGLVLLAPLAGGCSHQYRLRPGDEAKPIAVEGLENKRVAVVFTQPGFQPRFTASAGGHTYRFVYLDRYFEEWFGRALGGNFAALGFYRDEAPRGYDAYVYPALEMDIQSRVGRKCTTKMGITVLDADGRTIAEEQGEGAYSFSVTSLADGACKAAFGIAAIQPVSLAMGEIAKIGTDHAKGPPAHATAGGEAPEPEAVSTEGADDDAPAPPEPEAVSTEGADDDAPAPPEVTAEGDQGCVPACRRGYVCVRGQCVSACNPPCPSGQRCTEEGECVLAEGASAAAPAPPPTSQGPPSAAPDATVGPAPRSVGSQTATPASGAPQDTRGPGASSPSASDALGSGPSGSFNLRLGPTVSWFLGGHLGLEPAFRMTDGVYLVPAFHVGGGTGFEGGGQSWVSAGSDLGFRILRWRRVGWVAHVGAGATFLGEFAGSGLDYSYLAPYARLGGGLLFAKGERFGWGVEIVTRLGYSINLNSSYDGFFGGLDVSLVLTL